MKTIILGLGNPILTDDGVGIYVTRILEKLYLESIKPPSGTYITFQEASIGGFNFIDHLSGFDRAVIIDAIHTETGIPGAYYRLDEKSLKPSARTSSLHGIDFATACEMGRKMGIPFPSEIKIYVMEVYDEFSFGEKCTPLVDKSISGMARDVLQELENDGWI